jgi:hypothetical protein
MELDADTRYGRLKIPILKDEHKRVISMESFLVVRRKVYDNHAVLSWSSIDQDEMFPTGTSSNNLVLRNVELGWYVV